MQNRNNLLCSVLDSSFRWNDDAICRPAYAKQAGILQADCRLATRKPTYGWEL